MGRKKYILFDNDGVLVETEGLYYRASIEILKAMDVELSFAEYQKLMAAGTTVWEKAIAAGYSHDEIIAARERRNLRYRELIRDEEIEIPGAAEVIAELGKKYRMGIVTTSRRVDFELIHRRGTITKHMEFILCEEDYPRAKPYPDPYLKGLELFNADRNEAIVVEDSQRGLTAAVAAGIECVVVKNEFTKSQDFSEATHRIDALGELEKLL